MNPISDALSGLIVAGLTQLAKKVSFIPINPGETAKIRTLAVVLSVVATLVSDYASGNLANSSAISVVGSSLTAFVISQLGYHGIKLGASKLS